MTAAGNISYRASHALPRHGERYDRWYSSHPHLRLMWPLEQSILRAFLDVYFGEREIRLLDFACGTGRLTSFLEPSVATSVGVDISSTMLAAARQKVKKTCLIQADLTTGNVLHGQKFNLITAFRFFLNAEPPLRRAVIGILASLLTPDGFLVFNNHRHRAAPVVMRTYIRNRSRLRLSLNVMSIQEMRDLVAGAGLEIVEILHAGVMFRRLESMLPESWAWVIELAAARHKCFTPLSENLIAVCRRRPG